MFNKILTKNTKMKKSIIILLCIIVGSLKLSAQQDAQFTLFPWASLYYNPGTAGEQNNTLCFTGIYNQKYMGLKQAYPDPTNPANINTDNISPQDFLVNVEFFSRKIRGAIGVSFISDKITFFHNIGVRLGYTFRFNLGGGKMGIGFQAGLFNQSLTPDDFRALQEGDPLLQLLKDSESYMDLDFNFGLHYKAERWDIGISAVNLLGKKSISLSGGEELNLARQLYIHGGYNWTLPWNPSWVLEPKALIKTDFASFQVDIMALARYNGILWGGLSYRINDAVSLLFGARPFWNSSNNYLKGLDVGISYGFTTTKFAYTKQGSAGDFELMIRYCFDIFRQEVFSGYGSSRNIYKNQY